MDQKLKKVVEVAKDAGLESFILITRNGPFQTFHFEQMSIKDAMSMMIAGFHKVIDLELEKHPEYSEDYKKIFVGLAGRFSELIKSVNKEFDDYGKKKKK